MGVDPRREAITGEGIGREMSSPEHYPLTNWGSSLILSLIQGTEGGWPVGAIVEAGRKPGFLFVLGSHLAPIIEGSCRIP